MDADRHDDWSSPGLLSLSPADLIARAAAEKDRVVQQMLAEMTACAQWRKEELAGRIANVKNQP